MRKTSCFVWLMFYATAFADISSTTTVQRFSGASSTSGGPARIAGSRVEGGWTEAFVDFLQFANYMRGVLSGSPFEALGAYREFREFLDASGDKSSSERGYINVERGAANIDRVRLRFKVTSDDDPIGILRVAYPNEGPHRIGFSRPQVSGLGGRNGSVVLDVFPMALERGSYPVIFYTKETDCNMCLSIAHDIRIRITNPRACGAPPPICRTQEATLLQLETRIRQKQDEKQVLIQRAYEGGGAHAAINYEKKRLAICAHKGAPGSPQYESCVAEIPDLSGLCRSVAYAVRRDEICRGLADADREVERLTAERDRIQRFLASSICCPKPID